MRDFRGNPVGVVGFNAVAGIGDLKAERGNALKVQFDRLGGIATVQNTGTEQYFAIAADDEFDASFALKLRPKILHADKGFEFDATAGQR